MKNSEVLALANSHICFSSNVATQLAYPLVEEEPGYCRHLPPTLLIELEILKSIFSY